ncbi:hypothetical protein BBP40_003493 [Aspergillus hancockii]|nr:hypothetical protein BBP40_003493 [Aspergillus hancockii]
MSDDEDYYDEYDEDIFWIEEPDPEIADDLAATANNDAILWEDPSLEVEEYFSDWDDQSDDYYDEDPTVIRRQRAMGLWPNKQHNIKNTTPHHHNHHLIQPKETPIHKLPNGTIAIPPSFAGTVWKTATDDTPPRKLYEPGDGEKVALLKNWREVFRSSYPGVGRLRMIRKVGGASDMGLPRGARKVDAAVSSDETSAASSLENLRETDGGGSDVSKNTTPGEEELEPLVHSRRVVKRAADLPVNSKMLEREYPVEGYESYDDPMGMVTEESEVPATVTEVRHSSPKKTNSAAQPGRTRKRKAEDISKPRSKRVASKKVGETAEQAPASSGPVRRSTRNKAK